MFLRQIHDGFSYIGNTGPYEVSKKLLTLSVCGWLGQYIL